jgi:DNA-binding transcriptional LysR family regulator
MHQVRYFLAVADELNFTRAAEKCNVAQPSLTRAIRQLEGELGGDLFRRERPHAQLTELGLRMYPLLKQCYDSALGARSLASSLKSREIGILRLGLSRTISLDLIVPYLLELQRAFKTLDLKLLRGDGPEVLQLLKDGRVELAIAAAISSDWERLDRWPLFEEDFLFVANATNHLAKRKTVRLADLKGERLLLRSYCEDAEQFAAACRDRAIDIDHGHELSSERDLTTLLEADMGIAIVPRSAAKSQTLTHASVDDLDLRRTVYLYGVAGRERTAVATTIFKMLRGANWADRLGRDSSPAAL